MKRIKRVLFVDSYNRWQSVVAEYSLKDSIEKAKIERRNKGYNPDKDRIIGVRVKSAGTSSTTGATPLSKNAITSMKKRGIDISNHRIKHVGIFNINFFDLIICINPSDMKNIAERCPRGLVLLAENGNFCKLGRTIEECDALTEEIRVFVERLIKELLS